MSVHDAMDLVEDIKHKLNDNEYKQMCDVLMNIHNRGSVRRTLGTRYILPGIPEKYCIWKYECNNCPDVTYYRRNRCWGKYSCPRCLSELRDVRNNLYECYLGWD